jgi:hypothetical protein
MFRPGSRARRKARAGDHQTERCHGEARDARPSHANHLSDTIVLSVIAPIIKFSDRIYWAGRYYDI